MSAGQTGGQRQDPQGEIRPSPPGQYVYNKNDFQSGVIIAYVRLENWMKQFNKNPIMY